MSKHLFGLVCTPFGVAANNRGENEGNLTTLQKILWKGEVHTTVSAESIRWAIRYFWQQQDRSSVNRVWDDDAADHRWTDPRWASWLDEAGASATFIDDDVLGYMVAEAAADDGSDQDGDVTEQAAAAAKKGSKGKQAKKGIALKRRGALEVSRAISLIPFAGDITFNAKSGSKGSTSLYGTEVHATRYQYGFALTPERLRVPSRALKVVEAISGLGQVGGNHSRFLFDFSPDAVVFRWTDDLAPRFLYSFDSQGDRSASLRELIARIEVGDISSSELVLGLSDKALLPAAELESLQALGVETHGVCKAAEIVQDRIKSSLQLT